MKINLCAIAKNEDLYIKDWYDYYTNVIGIDIIYLFDNNDDDHMKAVLTSPYYSKLKYIHFPGIAKQKEAYNKYYTEHNEEADWHLFIDLDEYVCFSEELSFQDILKKVDNNIKSVVIPCYEIGDSDLVHYDDRPVMERFTKPALYNWHCVKSVVRKGLDYQFHSAHIAYHKNGKQFSSCYGNYKLFDPTYETNRYLKGTENDFNPASKFILYYKHFDSKTIEEYVKFKFDRTDALFSNLINMPKPFPNQYFFKRNIKTKEKLEVLSTAHYNGFTDLITFNEKEDFNELLKNYRYIHIVSHDYQSNNKRIVVHKDFKPSDVFYNKDNWDSLAEFYMIYNQPYRRSVFELNFLSNMHTN